MRAILYGLLLLLACRQAPRDQPLLHEESFENECEGVACGWQSISGEPDGVTWIVTVHEGEHGLRLQPGAAARGIVPTSVLRQVDISAGSLEAAASARCDTGGILSIEVLAVAADGSSDAYGGQFTAPPDWGRRSITTLAGDFALADGGMASAVPITTDLEVTVIVLRNTGVGSCEIDHLAIDGPGAASRVPAGACDGSDP